MYSDDSVERVVISFDSIQCKKALQSELLNFEQLNESILITYLEMV